MKYVFVETSSDLQDYLSAQPEKGDVIEGSGGLRKIRWADKKRGKGKRGGCARLLLVEVYGKNEQENFSAEDLRDFRNLVKKYKAVLSRGKIR